MPAPALPQPFPEPLPGTAPLRREYRDALGRPMTGTVTITGTQRHTAGERVTPVAPVVADLVAGVLEVDLPPDTYTLTAALRTVDGNRVGDTDTANLT